ncbi:GntR family transcriptional regulator [Granulosicoccus antarcticus]|uniref:Putative HTH-type transcriptional regulator n=1 Tax=Granulosicoccus antarcticus IMCC3135 TaxID=1192854 RepID=A0A2Z2NRR9_9GAMM|nr:GntR family transcriptional regulator [Granulosicoccus antarcticus]ASJ74063.1 putative HTH-type transcriptional regulator [Granulosicoccus antarcticus IMCC3135]
MTSNGTEQEETNSLYEAVLNDISTGELEGGQRLKVAELARRYGVSTSPVREVLRRMQGEGYVVISPNRGATIRMGDANTIQNIFEILELLEPYFVAWFAEFAPPDLLDEMEAIQEKIEKTPISELAVFRKLDYEFHWAICKRHYNQPAAETWYKLRRALNVYGAKLSIKTPRHETILVEHRALLAALRKNDVEESLAVIKRHTGGSFKQMSQQMRVLGIT